MKALSSPSLQKKIEKALAGVPDPCGRHSLAQTARVVSCGEDKKGRWHLAVRLAYPADDELARVEAPLTAALAELKGDDNIALALSWRVYPGAVRAKMRPLAEVRNIIAVSSAKGGVGKSTVALNLALGLKHLGARAGILDADIYGPSQRIMLGVPESQRPDTKPPKYLLPIEAHGVQSMSIGYLLTEKTPVAWRGPMVSGALQQMLSQTLWRDLDYLVVDMPPGTGDIALTLAQKVPVTANIIVTTPQALSLADARRGIGLWRKFELPLLGIVENMAYHQCGDCGTRSALFGEGGGEILAKECDSRLLGSLPLIPAASKSADDGAPLMESNSEFAPLFKELARTVACEIAALPADNSHKTLDVRNITDAMA